KHDIHLASSVPRPNTAPANAQPPEETIGPTVKPISKVAGGMTSALTAAKFAFSEMGVVRGTRTLLQLNQKQGIDCPGCAWPEPDGERSHFEFCEEGAKHVGDEATSKRVTPEFFAKWSVKELAEQSDLWLNQQGRITHPMILHEGAQHYEAIDWKDAFALLAQELNALDSPDEAIFYTSGRTSNEAAFLYQLFVRQFGTNNLPDCSNMCHESSGTGMKETLGFGKGTVTLEDFDLCDAIFVIGQNPGTNHPRMLTTLLNAKRRGCKIVHINPLPEAGTTRFKHPQEFWTWLGSGTQLADLFLQVRINGDVALLKGIMKELLDAEERRPGEVLDHNFINKHTTGFGEFKEALRKVHIGDILDQSGISKVKIEDAARIFIESERVIFCWAMGLTQHKNAVANIQEIVNLMLLRGQLGKPGAGLCPVRGHSNVQGDRTMGIWEQPSEDFLDKLGAEFNFNPPRRHGYDTVHAIQAMHEAPAKVFFALGGNFLSATPDTEYTAEALRRCRVTAHVSTKLNRAHLITGNQALILPCLGRTEIDEQASGPQFVTTENSMAVVGTSEGRLTPAAPELLSEPAIVAELAKAVCSTNSSLSDKHVDWDGLIANYDRIRDHIERVVPGFENYNQRVRQPGGFYLPNPIRDLKFNTPDARAHFTVHPLARINLNPGQFLMMTMRSHDQFNTTIYGLDDRYRGIHNGRRVVFLNSEDIRLNRFQDGQIVDLISHFEGEERVARSFRIVPYSIPRRCAATYFPETNVLVPVNYFADKSHTPASKSVVISIRPAVTEPLAVASGSDAQG
ncbi:MAG TPA: FdhF/YdeP family oxidoreductase, partial [Pyrinomonadaceae bacterium]|nr:FdhF/YdeP family oxidoreductase [Pyrinomonadaceae bacterium]